MQNESTKQNVSEAIEAIRKSLGKRLCIMGHHYESDAIIRHCDVTGDSLELSRKVAGIEAEYIVFCGVSFMGESAALLSEEGQKVLLPAPEADCQMARMAAAPDARKVLEALGKAGAKVVPLAYVNTDVPLKAVVGEFGGSVCTSANARTMLAWALKQAPQVLFLPDMHLGRNTAKELGLSEKDWRVLDLSEAGMASLLSNPPKERLLLWPGYCPIHAAYTKDMVASLRGRFPGCRVTVHPEASPEIVAACDAAGSTSFLIKDAEAKAKEGGVLVVGTELNLVRRIAKLHEGNVRIVPLSEEDGALCPDMALVTEERLLAALEAAQAGAGTPVRLNASDIAPARAALTRMLDICRK